MAIHGYVLSGGSFRTIDIPGAGATYAHGINAAGDIVGYYTDATLHLHGFWLHSGQFTNLDIPGSFVTYPYGINDNGDIVGTCRDFGFHDHGFLIRRATITTIDIPGATWASAQGISSNGLITGAFGDATTSKTRGFVLTRVPSPCAFSLSAFGANVSSGSGLTGASLAGAFTISGINCTAENVWTAVSDSPHLLVTSKATGSGGSSTTITYSMYTNSSTQPRTAHIIVAGRTFTVTQAGSTESTNQRVVRALYQTILGREPDSAGWAFWTGSGPPTDPVTGSVMFHAMADSFYRSPEFSNTGWAVLSITMALTGRFPDFQSWLATTTQIRHGALSMTQLTETLAGGLSKSGFVSAAYQNGFGRQPTADEMNSALAGLIEGKSKFAILSSLVSSSSSEFVVRSNPQLVTALYYTILLRDADAGGLQFWTDQLTHAPGQPGIYPVFNSPATAYARKLAVIGQAIPPDPRLLGFLGGPEFQRLIR